MLTMCCPHVREQTQNLSLLVSYLARGPRGLMGTPVVTICGLRNPVRSSFLKNSIYPKFPITNKFLFVA